MTEAEFAAIERRRQELADQPYLRGVLFDPFIEDDVPALLAHARAQAAELARLRATSDTPCLCCAPHVGAYGVCEAGCGCSQGARDEDAIPASGG